MAAIIIALVSRSSVSNRWGLARYSNVVNRQGICIIRGTLDDAIIFTVLVKRVSSYLGVGKTMRFD